MAFNRTIRFPAPGSGRTESLSEKLRDYFTLPSEEKGETYYQQGRVVITRGAPAVVTARVRGSRPYQVSLVYDAGALKVSCECPYFLSSGACKHIWATILAAEGQTFLSAAAEDPKLTLLTTSGAGTETAARAQGAVEPAGAQSTRSKVPDWRRQIEQIQQQRSGILDLAASAAAWPEKREVLYVVDGPASKTKGGSLVLGLESRDRRQDGTHTRPVPLRLRKAQIGKLPADDDREALAALAGGREYFSFGLSQGYDALPESFSLTPELAGIVLPAAVRTGRCFLRTGRDAEPALLRWDEQGVWRLTLQVRRTRRGWGAAGVLRRGEARMEVTDPVLVTGGGFIFVGDRVARLAKDTPFEWLIWLRGHGMLEAPENDAGELLGYLLCTPGLPEVEVPEELRYEEIRQTPRPGLRFHSLQPNAMGARLAAELWFDYGGRAIDSRATERGYFNAAERRLIRRDEAAERAAAGMLASLGLRYQSQYGRHPREAWELAPTKVPAVVRALVEVGWNVEADGKRFRRPGKARMAVVTSQTSGVDWFELRGGVDYGDSTAQLPELLAALRRGENMVQLGDGTYGLLPEEWIRRMAVVAGMGTTEDGQVRFRRSQAGLLDALLAARPEATWDEGFERVRSELLTFDGLKPTDQPAGFNGQLRDYQREGLGWIEFLRRFSFGGCLADDMGTGKTAQVLAMLEMRRVEKGGSKRRLPSLVVVPRSLIFNWKEEAARFTPKLKVLDYSGPDRDLAKIDGNDLVLTTYGTLRRDIRMLKDVAFEYAVLDEAQTVKNSGSEGAKAVRLLRAEHRLALSGTPMENHLGELWSLFEFLNPGMLGSASVFRVAGGAMRNPDEGVRQVLGLALRPFILRRTKEQVARELPARTEQTVYCELEPEQRKLYNELRGHYRDSLRMRIEKDGLAKSKIMVLEALLRLRQAACHAGLIDAKRTGETSAKLEVLMDQVEEVLESGHKALVFSQFTSLLAIVRERLDKQGVVYEYLDGKTRDRQARVDRFQSDAKCPLFLISLKAGGLGLNLTAADYVFLLDPWWNPAVEAQAIDRAHRIGQTRPVSAYRLIARDTVEEKVLELQKTKRDLAAAIIGANNSMLRDLKREDLELLLS
jgi:superfamily II DNA or RNA helicase